MLMLPDYRVRQRDFLLEISRAITAQLDLGEVLRLVLNASVVMLAGQIGLVALRDSSGDYQIRATVGLESARIPALNQQLRDLVSNVDEGLDHQTLDNRMKAMLASLERDLRQYV